MDADPAGLPAIAGGDGPRPPLAHKDERRVGRVPSTWTHRAATQQPCEKSVVQWPAVADKIYAEGPHSKRPISDWIVAKVKLLGDEDTEIPLWVHGHMKYCTAAFRGHQRGARYAEAYMSLDKRVMGRRILQEIASRVEAQQRPALQCAGAAKRERPPT